MINGKKLQSKVTVWFHWVWLHHCGVVFVPSPFKASYPTRNSLQTEHLGQYWFGWFGHFFLDFVSYIVKRVCFWSFCFDVIYDRDSFWKLTGCSMLFLLRAAWHGFHQIDWLHILRESETRGSTSGGITSIV